MSILNQSTSPGIYAITDSHLMPNDEVLIDRVTQAIKAGISLLQYRDKSGDGDKRLRQAKKLLHLCEENDIPFIINDDVDLAERLGAGVHLGLDDGSISVARSRLGKQAIIGATCHGSFSLAQQAMSEGASYLACGRFFPSNTKPDALPAELSLIPQIKTLGLPVIAIGGIDATNAKKVVNVGADYIAVVNAIFADDNVEKAVVTLKRALDQV